MYYYAKVREGSKVRSVYVGRSDLSGIFDDLAIEARMKRAFVKEREEAENDLYGATEAQFKATMETIRSTLESAGLYKHRGEWRRSKNV